MCDTLCVLADGRVLFAKNSDRPLGEVQVFRSFERRDRGDGLRTQYLTIPDTGAFACAGAQPTWLWGMEHGVNEHRVAIGNERVWTTDDAGACAPGLLGMDLVRLGLERARSATEAIDVITALIEAHGQGGAGEPAGDAYFSSFLVADPAGAWILETSDRTWAARAVDRDMGGASISNRVTIATDWTRASPDVAPGASFQAWRDPVYPTPHADQRLAVTRAAACARPAPSARTLAGVLRHHGDHPWGAIPTPGCEEDGEVPVDALPVPRVRRDGSGVSVCMHLRGWEATTGSMIAELSEDPALPARAWVALGNPCVGVYVPVFPDDLVGSGRLVPNDEAGVAGELADPTWWHRFDGLKHRVEAARDATDPPGPDLTGAAIAEVRAVLGPLEAELWGEADEVAAGPADDRAAFRRSIAPRLDRALTALEVPAPR